MLKKFKLLKKISKLDIPSDFYTILSNLGWLFADRIIRMGIGLLLGVWVARYLGVQQFGVFNYAIAFVAIFSSFSTLGLDVVVIRSIVREPEKRMQILGATFWLKLFGGISALALAVSCIAVVHHDDRLTISLVAILSSIGIFQAFDTIDLWFQSQVQSKYTVLAKNIAFVIVSLIKIILINIKAPLITFAWLSLGEVGLGAIGLMICYKNKGYSPWLWPWSFPLIKTLLGESWPLILAGISTVIYMRIDQIMIGEMIGNKALGIYSAAIRVSEIWYFIPIAICSSVNPSIFAAKEKSETLYYRKLEKLLRILMFVSIVIAIPMSFMADTLILILFGNGYAQAGKILAIHIWSSFFVFMGIGISTWFAAEGLIKFELRSTLFGLIANIFLNLFLIPAYAGVGAALATVISQSIATFFVHRTHPKTKRIFDIQVKLFLNLGARNK